MGQPRAKGGVGLMRVVCRSLSGSNPPIKMEDNDRKCLSIGRDIFVDGEGERVR
jgi:hypothetical protein